MDEIGIEDAYVNDHSFWGEMDSAKDNLQYNVHKTDVSAQKPNLQFQTILALQQLGLVISVVLLRISENANGNIEIPKT